MKGIMSIRFIGDVHGKFRPFKKLIKNAERSVQVGDLGVGFKKYNYCRDLVWDTNPPHALMVKHNCKFIRGNHENPSVCRRHSQWIKDGTIENDVMYIGGAVSIDRAFRTEGIDWWADEECSYNEIQVMIDNYIIKKPRVMVTHDCPESIADVILSQFNRAKYGDPSRTRQALEVMRHYHKPEIHIFGHWHKDLDITIDGTRFICLGELSYIDLDI